MLRRNNVLVRIPRPTTKSYQDAVALIIRSIQGEMTDGELADRLGCSVGTIRNARDRRGCLNGVTLANIEREFGPSALDPFLALGGSRAVPLHASCSTDGGAELALLDALRAIIETQHPDSEGGSKTTPSEARKHIAILRDARLVLDNLIVLADEAPELRSVA